MKQYIVLLLMLVARDQIFAQKLHFMPRVNTPDSIGEKESLAYDTELDSYSKKGWPTYNMLYPKKYSYGNGIYIYQHSGYHYPPKIFINYNSRVYFFKHFGCFDPCDIIHEYSECLDKLKISNDDAINYLEAIWSYLRREIKMDYGIYVKETANPQVSQIEKDTTVYDIADQMPVFPGGNNELHDYLDKAVKSSMLFKKKSPGSNSYVSFIIERDGTVSNVKVIHSFDPKEDPELLRIVSEMPKWIPGENKGRTVRISYNLAIP